MKRAAISRDRWWVKRWLDVLESFGWSGRLQRGRAYARSGRVISMDVQPGVVVAEVAGQQPQPYQVTIKLAPFAASDWEQIIAVLLRRPVYVAKLLAGELPGEINEVFSAVHLNLFPGSAKDLQTECSCPDWANPCKHIAAVYYALGQTFASDPFLLLALRGMSQSEILSRLQERWARRLQPPADSVDATAFWALASDVDSIPLQLSQEDVTSRVLPMVWGPPHFMEELGQKGARELVSLFADVLQTSSQLAQKLVREDE